jgi:predicted ATPase
VKRRDVKEPIAAADLSDGQLSWLAFVALARLGRGRTLLAFDEPEAHLHPALLGRVVDLLQTAGEDAPVVVSTHADRVLELLDDPASAIRVCSLEGDNRAVVAGLDRTELGRWLAQYGDLAALRASGFLKRVVAAPPTTSEL